jgi:hypothetical protein
MGQMGILITWKELTGIIPAKTQVQQQLAPYSLRGILLGLARLSAQLVTWQQKQNYEGELEAVRRMLPRYFPAIAELVAASSGRVILTRITLLYVAKQALSVCPLEGREVETAWDDEQIMTCCLMANDLLLGRTPRPEDRVIDKASSLLPFSNYLPDFDDPLDIPRNLILMEEIAPLLADRRDYRDLGEEFRVSTGVRPQTFCEFVFCAGTKFVTNLAEQNNPAGLVLTPEFFRHTRVADELEAFVRRYSITLKDLMIKYRQTPTLDDDFIVFQERPLIEFVSGHYMCIDPGFLLDKAGRSFYWTLHNTTSLSQRGRLLGYWATLVERYVQWLTEQMYRGRGTVINSPRFANNDEVCDIAIREGSRLILIEVKAAVLTAKAKYSFEPQVLQEELLRKAIQGEEGERKGVAQLHRAIQRFQSGEDIQEIQSNDITLVYPVLVFLDKSFTSPYLSTLYRNGFDRKALRKRPKTTSPIAITVRDIESILPMTHAHDLSDILDDYYRRNRTADGMPTFGRMVYANIPILRNVERGHDIVRERWKRFNEELIANIFPATQPDHPRITA